MPVYYGFRTERLSLWLVLRRVRQWPFVLDHLAQIAAVDPTVARRAADEIIGLVLWRIADANAQIFAGAGSSFHGVEKQLIGGK